MNDCPVCLKTLRFCATIHIYPFLFDLFIKVLYKRFYVEYRSFSFEIFRLRNVFSLSSYFSLITVILVNFGTKMTFIFPYFDNGHFGRHNGHFGKSQRSFWGSITVILVNNGQFGCITVILVQNNGHFGHDFFGLTVILVCSK